MTGQNICVAFIAEPTAPALSRNSSEVRGAFEKYSRIQ
jgi:hypothetical protein